jgi:hypothetical protein
LNRKEFYPLKGGRPSSEILRKYSEYLTDFEKQEIKKFTLIYYFGQNRD